MSQSGMHTEDYHLKKLFEHHQNLLNDHHQTIVVMYKCKKSGRMVVAGGENVQERLEYLVENDIRLKNAILDDEDAMNRCGRSQDFISGQPQQAFNRVRAQSRPARKLPFPVKYLNDREACEYITQYIWDKYLESFGVIFRVLAQSLQMKFFISHSVVRLEPGISSRSPASPHYRQFDKAGEAVPGADFQVVRNLCPRYLAG